MAGVYLHIPFCRKACTYCDFHFSTNLKRRDDMVTALGQELLMRANYLPQESVLSSIYFGGGTPSVLHPDQIASLIQQIASVWALAENAEITLEANPDDLSPAVLAGLKSAGVNRLSIGVQSFLERDLVAMNRSHNANQATQAVEESTKSGIRQYHPRPDLRASRPRPRCLGRQPPPSHRTRGAAYFGLRTYRGKENRAGQTGHPRANLDSTR
jgi:oxygen-independent coproporphyrinogen-3 oxidase